jgi:hypothetical protein
MDLSPEDAEALANDIRAFLDANPSDDVEYFKMMDSLDSIEDRLRKWLEGHTTTLANDGGNPTDSGKK